MHTPFLAFQRLFDYLHSHLQPWFRADVEAILNEPDLVAVGEGEYVSMHIRRGDKLLREATKTKTEVIGVFLSRSGHDSSDQVGRCDKHNGSKQEGWVLSSTSDFVELGISEGVCTTSLSRTLW